MCSSICRGTKTLADYRRELDIGNALAHVSYQSGGVNYQREYFCSHPDGVLVVRLTADQPGSYTGSIELNDSHGAQTVAERNRLAFAGALNNGLKYEAQLIVLPGRRFAPDQRRDARIQKLQQPDAHRRRRHGLRHGLCRKISRRRPARARDGDRSKRPPRQKYDALKAAQKRIIIRSSTASPLDLGKSSPATNRHAHRPAQTGGRRKPLTPAWSSCSSNTGATCSSPARAPAGCRPICRACGTTTTVRRGIPIITRTSTSR